MKKGLLIVTAVFCSISLFMASIPSISFAESNGFSTKHTNIAEETADNIASLTSDIDIDVVDEYEELPNAYCVDGDSISYEIPKDSDEAITTIFDEGVKIGMSLPQELTLGDGEVARDGSVVYTGEDDANVCTQVIEQDMHGEEVYFNRTSIVIDNSNAPHQYTFDFELPDGFKLCTADDYNKTQAEYYKHHKIELIDSGMSEAEYEERLSELKMSSEEVFVVDKDNEIVEVIGEAWAKDSNGYDVETRYEIEDNKLIQCVDFNEDSLFPIIADPETHPTKYKYFSLKKASVKTLRDNYASSSRSVIVGYIVSVAVTSFSLASVAITSVALASTLYSVEQHKLWTKVHDGFTGSNNMVKIRVSYIWNGLHKAYAPSNKVKVVSYYKQ